MAAFRVCLAALAIVQGTKLEGPSQDAVNELRAKMEKIGTRVQGLYAAGGPLAKTKIVDRLQAWHEQFEKKVHSLDGSLVMQFQRLSEAETSVQDLSKEIDKEKGRLSAESTQQQESLLLGVLMTRQKEPFIEQLKVLISKDFSALPQKQILDHIQAHGDFKTPVVHQVAEYLDAHRRQLEAPAPTPKQAAPIPQKAEQKAVAVAEHKDAAMVTPEQKSMAEHKAPIPQTAEHKTVAVAEHKDAAMVTPEQKSMAEHKAPILQKAEHKTVAVAEHKDAAMVTPEQKSMAEHKAPIPQKAEHKAVAVAEQKDAAMVTPEQISMAEHKAPIPQKAEHKAVAVAEHKDVAMDVAMVTPEPKSMAEQKAAAGNLRKILQQQHEVGEHQRVEAEKHIKVMFRAARKHKQHHPDLAKQFGFLGRAEQKKLKRKVAMEQKQEAALANAAAAVEAGDAVAAAKAQHELQDLLDEQMGKKKKFLVLLDLVGSSGSKDCPYCVGQCMEKCHTGGNTYVTCLTTCANAKE